jgi:hypothetical protein
LQKSKAYGRGEAGFIGFKVFWPNMGKIILAEQVIFCFRPKRKRPPGGGRFLETLDLP